MKGIKFDNQKLRWDLLPIEAIEEVVKVISYGSVKYNDNNWKHVKPFEDRYYAACLRHLVAWRKGIKKDDESKLSTLAHAICCLIFLLSKETKE